MNLEDVVLSEMNQSQEGEFHGSPLTRGPRRARFSSLPPFPGGVGGGLPGVGPSADDQVEGCSHHPSRATVVLSFRRVQR